MCTALQLSWFHLMCVLTFNAENGALSIHDTGLFLSAALLSVIERGSFNLNSAIKSGAHFIADDSNTLYSFGSL